MLTAMMEKNTMLLGTLTSPDEKDLVRAAQKGDLDVFNQLVLLYQERIFSLAYRILGNEDLAEDITQNTFLKAYLNLSHFHNGSFRSWLYQVAVNACIDELRKYKKHPELPLGYDESEDERLLPPYELTDSRMQPEKEHDRRELERAVQRALDRLDPDQRAVVVLVDLQDFDYQEAARVLRVPLGTVKSRLARARMRLHPLLKEYS
jgi:RNA polymerase sigma-70 factor (ECF subfamily)